MLAKKEQKRIFARNTVNDTVTNFIFQRILGIPKQNKIGQQTKVMKVRGQDEQYMGFDLGRNPISILEKF